MVVFGRDNGDLTLRSEVIVPRSLEEIFPFFADAKNLEALTPEFLNFKILTATPIDMKVGLHIDYRIWLSGIPMKWRSEITAWEPPRRFVDEQRRGPYLKWVHEHVFKAQDKGTVILDSVRYRVLGGELVNRFLVQPKLKRIFEFRAEKIQGLFQ